jgi:hypothetical protein
LLLRISRANTLTPEGSRDKQQTRPGDGFRKVLLQGGEEDGALWPICSTYQVPFLPVYLGYKDVISQLGLQPVEAPVK